MVLAVNIFHKSYLYSCRASFLLVGLPYYVKIACILDTIFKLERFPDR